MRRRDLALVLRLLGPVLQVVSLVLLFQVGDAASPWLGWPARQWCYAGFALGFLLVLCGLVLTAFQRGTQREQRS